MAKLKAYGREVIFEVERESNEKDPLKWKKEKRAVTSDGTVLSQFVVNIENSYRTSGFEPHNYGWKVDGKAKPGLTAEDILEIYCKKGFKIVSAPGLPRVERPYYDALTAMASMGGKVPTRTHPAEGQILRTAEAAAKQKASKQKAALKRTEEAKTKNGAGFYVTNGTIGFKRVADHSSPFPDYEKALEFATNRYVEFVTSKFHYLLPVKIIESDSRMNAVTGRGHVWWIDGKEKGPGVSTGQLGLPGVNGNL